MMLVPRRDFDLFDDFFNDPFFKGGERHTHPLMKTDIKETDDSYIIDVDLPGFDKKDIQIDVENGYLNINAKSEESNDDEEKGKYIRRERYYGECSRSFYIGEDVHEHLLDAPVLPDLNSLRTALTREHAPVGLPVIENVILPVDALDPAVVVAVAVFWGLVFIFREDVRIAHHHAAVDEPAVGPVAHRVAELVERYRRVDEVVFPAYLPDRAGLKELMTLKAGPLGLSERRKKLLRLLRHGFHVIHEPHDHRSFRLLADRLLRARSVARVEVDLPVVIHKDARVEGDRVARPLAQRAAVFVRDDSIKMKFSRRTVRHRYPDRLDRVVRAVEQVVFSVLPAADIRGPELVLPVRHAGIDVSRVNDTLVAPVRKILHIRRVADVVVHAELLPAEAVVAPVDVDAVAEDVRLTVRDVFVAGEVGVEGVFFHEGSFHHLDLLILYHTFSVYALTNISRLDLLHRKTGLLKLHFKKGL